VAPTQKLAALVVDDEPSLVRVVEGHLLQDGYDRAPTPRPSCPAWAWPRGCF
jgi:hypothetical protein